MPRISTSFLRSFVSDAVNIRRGRPHRIRPLILTYFVTFRCDLSCSYCDYAEENYAHRFAELDTAGARTVLRLCRKGIPALAISGGEPLVRDDIVELVHHAKALGYKPISLFTNSLKLEDKAEVLSDVDYLQVSLDTMDTGLQDRLCGRSGVGKRIIANIVRYASQQKEERFRLNINCVLSTENLDSVPDLLRFAADTRVRFTFSPRLDATGQPERALLKPDIRQQYRQAVETILRFKHSTKLVLDIDPFLRHLMDFQPGPCHPMLTPRVYPDGTLRFPCSIIARTSSSVLRCGTWEEIEKELMKTSTECETHCLLPCYLESSLLAENPLALLQEIL